MAIKQVIANKRCLMIRPYELSNLQIGLTQYTPITEYEYSGSSEPDYAADKEPFFSYGSLEGSIGTPYNMNFALALTNYTKVGETSSGVPHYKQNRVIIVRDKKLFHYDDNKYTLKVITSNMQYHSSYKLDTYFENKKLFKVLDIYVDNFDVTKKVANIKIYYLEKK